MYEIDIRYASDKWRKHLWKINKVTSMEAFLMGVASIEEAMRGIRYDLLPIATGEFVIWAQGKCVGFYSIAAISDLTNEN